MDERDAMRLAIAQARLVEGRTAPRTPVVFEWLSQPLKKILRSKTTSIQSY